jgi:hypothetical protein
VLPRNTGIPDWDSDVTRFWMYLTMETEIRLLWAVIIAAALGSYVHSITSFSSYVGNRAFSGSWVW